MTTVWKIGFIHRMEKIETQFKCQPKKNINKKSCRRKQKQRSWILDFLAWIPNNDIIFHEFSHSQGRQTAQNQFQKENISFNRFHFSSSSISRFLWFYRHHSFYFHDTVDCGLWIHQEQFWFFFLWLFCCSSSVNWSETSEQKLCYFFARSFMAYFLPAIAQIPCF